MFEHNHWAKITPPHVSHAANAAPTGTSTHRRYAPRGKDQEEGDYATKEETGVGKTQPVRTQRGGEEEQTGEKSGDWRPPSGQQQAKQQEKEAFFDAPRGKINRS